MPHTNISHPPLHDDARTGVATRCGDAECVQQLALFACKSGPGDPDFSRVVAALVGAIVIMAARRPDPIGVVRAAIEGLQLAVQRGTEAMERARSRHAEVR